MRCCSSAYAFCVSEPKEVRSRCSLASADRSSASCCLRSTASVRHALWDASAIVRLSAISRRSACASSLRADASLWTKCRSSSQTTRSEWSPCSRSLRSVSSFSVQSEMARCSVESTSSRSLRPLCVPSWRLSKRSPMPRSASSRALRSCLTRSWQASTSWRQSCWEDSWALWPCSTEARSCLSSDRSLAFSCCELDICSVK
mmetsp:Transcript_2669/g.6773  ORF Transcript_2669/g.6773 Transcript_2669/m.6773 type:complete len:202 (-) Transcript_2669:402-1007(-)